MTDTSESMKIVFSLDLYFGMIRTEELDEMGQIMVKILKNRYGNNGQKFVLGVDFAKSLLFDVEQNAQKSFGDSNDDDTPLFDRSKTKTVNADKFKF